MFDWLKKYYLRAINPNFNFTGALVAEDEAPIVFSDVVAKANVVDWKKTTYRSFPAFNQNRTNECGAFSGKKHLGICYAQKYKNFIEFSEEDIYQRRITKVAGMYLPDIMRIMQEGVTLKALTNVDNITDADADNAVIDKWKRDVGKLFAINQPIYIPAGDFDTIASVIQTTGKSVIGMMYFTYDEWARSVPKYLYPSLEWTSSSTLRHFINFVDYATIDGQQVLVVEDSAWFGGLSTRFVTREFLKARNVPVPMANAYMMNFKFDTSATGGTQPRFDGTIISLQKCLQSLGMFPSNVSYFEGIGNVTKGALAKFQSANGLAITENFDSATRAVITQLFP